jgi:hypothetical protein
MNLELRFQKNVIKAYAINYNSEKKRLTVNLKDNTKNFDMDSILAAKNIDVSIFFGNKLYTQFECELIKVQNEKMEITFDLLEELPEYLYDQNVIDIFNHWQEREEESFYDLSVLQKKSWLHACLIYSGLPSKINKPIIEIDCILINDKYDLFYLLGESFIGPKGYFGRDFEGVRDCLYLCGRENNTKIVFKNSYKLNLLFEKMNFSKDEFLTDFSKLGYTLDL